MASYIHLPERPGIYMIKNLVNGKVYIGYASNIRQRVRGHFSDLNKLKHPNDYLQKSWCKYEGDFESVAITYCDKENLCKEEDFWIKKLNSTDRKTGYNIKEGNPLGIAGCTEETKEKLRLANKGKKPSSFCIQRRKEVVTSEEGKKRQRESLRKVDWFKVRENKRKPVINLLTGEVYKSGRIAAEALGIPSSRLSKYLTGSRTNKTTLKYLL